MSTRNPIRLDAERSFDTNPENAYSLPARYYTDPEIFEREKEFIFYRSWIYVGHLAHFEKPGDYLTTQIADESVFVIRDHDRELRGFYNVCRHRAHQLLQGAGNVNAIVCPYHAWTYESDGRLRHARHADKVAGFDAANFCLKPVQVEVFCGFVFVNLDMQAASLASQAGDLAEDLAARFPKLGELRCAADTVFGAPRMQAGWKIVVDNYVECYHCTLAHPDFADIIDMNDYRMESFGLWSRQLGMKTKNKNTAYDFSPESSVTGAVFWYLWPNTTFNVFPGSAAIQVFTVRPFGIDSSSFEGHTYLADELDNPARNDYIANVLGPEDQAICESVQRGLRSRSYNQGRFVIDPEKSGIAEHALHQFHCLVKQALG